MSANMASTSERYDAASKKFEDAYNKYSGEEGMKLADKYAEEKAGVQSLRAGQSAGAASNRTARSAGLSKAQAAMLGEQSASDASGNAYQGIYDSSRNAALQNNANTMNARTSALNSAQTEGMNEYNRAWGNFKAPFAAGTGLLGTILSDERLKTFKDVSSKLDSKPDENSWELLKVEYKKEK